MYAVQHTAWDIFARLLISDCFILVNGFSLVKSRVGWRTYLTRFWVHSRSFLTSLAAFMPSAKLARVPFNRRCASACNSASSRCLAFNSPDLYVSVSLISSLNGGSHVCACFAILRSSGSGSIAVVRRSLSMSRRSTPDDPPWPCS